MGAATALPSAAGGVPATDDRVVSTTCRPGSANPPRERSAVALGYTEDATPPPRAGHGAAPSCPSAVPVERKEKPPGLAADSTHLYRGWAPRREKTPSSQGRKPKADKRECSRRGVGLTKATEDWYLRDTLPWGGCAICAHTTVRCEIREIREIRLPICAHTTVRCEIRRPKSARILQYSAKYAHNFRAQEARCLVYGPAVPMRSC